MELFKIMESSNEFPVVYSLDVALLIGNDCIVIWSDGNFSDEKEEWYYFPLCDTIVALRYSLWQGVGADYSVESMQSFFSLGEYVTRTRKVNHPTRWVEGLKRLLEARDEARDLERARDEDEDIPY